MSTHTIIKTRFHNMDDLVDVLNRSGISWKQRYDIYNKASMRIVNCAVEASVNGEIVWFTQAYAGGPVVIQSLGHYFQDAGQMRGIANAETNQEAQQRLALEQARREAEAARIEQQRRQEEARRAAEEAKRLRMEAEARRAELGRIEDEAGKILSRMAELESRPAAPPPVPSPQPTPGADKPTDQTEAPAEMPISDANLLLGRLMQQHAEARVLEVLDALETSHGIQFDHRRVSEDDSIEIVLRG